MICMLKKIAVYFRIWIWKIVAVKFTLLCRRLIFFILAGKAAIKRLRQKRAFLLVKIFMLKTKKNTLKAIQIFCRRCVMLLCVNVPVVGKQWQIIERSTFLFQLKVNMPEPYIVHFFSNYKGRSEDTNQTIY